MKFGLIWPHKLTAEAGVTNEVAQSFCVVNSPPMSASPKKMISTWLLVGVTMIVIQVLLGGVTRLTGSGLSITEWKPIMGTLPPLNEAAWMETFDKYKTTPQFHLLNSQMTLAGFKKIFWWEYIHRLWARLFLPVFLLPLIYFLWKKMVDRKLLMKLLFVFVLGGMQAVLGWVMVQSGLIDRPWVSPLNLSAHLVLALFLLGYLFWIALEVMNPARENSSVAGLKKLLLAIIALLGVQIYYGGLMAGNHAALFYPTFPKIGSQWLPEALFVLKPAIANFFQNVGLLHVIHRGLGFLLAALIIVFYLKARKKGSLFFQQAVILFPFLTIVQVALGILTLLTSLGKIPLLPAVSHQLCAVGLLLVATILIYQVVHAGSAPQVTRR